MFVRLGLAALTVSLGIGGLAEDVVHWSYPPRAWPRWEIQKARAYTYANGMYVGYPVVLSDVTKDATFRRKDGQALSVSASSQGGVPCVRGDGWEVKTGSGKWVACDVFEGAEDTPPHLLGYPTVKGVPTFRDGLYSAEGETVAFIWCRSAKRPVLRVGESREEALSEDLAGFEQNVRMEPTGKADEWRSVAPLAFRHYRFVEPVEETWFVRDEMRRPLAGAYRSDDERLNRIWRASAETVRLCTRRFFVDAVKRDRMPWPGDDAIAFLADWATYRNAEAARFTIDALSCATFDGLADYSPWWVIINGLYRRLYDDPDFIRRRWSVIRRRTDALSASLRKDGAAEKAADRNFYIDWGDRGNPTAAYNVLMFAAFDTAAALAEELGKVEDAARWRTQAKKIADALASLAYDPKTGLFRCDIDDPSSKPYRQPNLLAVLFGLVKGAEAQRIGDALAKDDLPGVGTAWMAGLECIALMMTGHKDVVPQRIDRIWGGMVDLGFNTIFEHWWPEAKGADVFRFYDRPFGLSLCHVASPAPAYLLPALQQEGFTNPFDAKAGQPILRFGVVSDVHVRGMWNVGKFEEALRYFDSAKADAVMVCGDLADDGFVAELERFASVWKRTFPRDRRSDGAPIEKLFIYGDHDTGGYAHVWRDYQQPREFYGMTKEEADAALIPVHGRGKVWERVFGEPWRPVMEKHVKGFRFVLAHYSGGRSDADPAGLQDILASVPTNERFFYVQHRPIRDAVARILGERPNVVAFTGHLHENLSNAGSFSERPYAHVSVPSLHNLNPPKGEAADGASYQNKPTQCLLVEVCPQTTRLLRIDASDKTDVGFPWTVPVRICR